MTTDDKDKIQIAKDDAWQAVAALNAYTRELLAESRKFKKRGMKAHAQVTTERADLIAEVRERVEDALLADSRAKAAEEETP